MGNIEKIKLTMSENNTIRVVQKQENFNTLNKLQYLKSNSILVESQIGIGTIYNLKSIFNSIDDIHLSFTIGSSFDLPIFTQGANIIIDIDGFMDDINVEEMFKKLRKNGFNKIIIVTRLDTKESQDRFSGIMVD